MQTSTTAADTNAIIVIAESYLSALKKEEKKKLKKISFTMFALGKTHTNLPSKFD